MGLMKGFVIAGLAIFISFTAVQEGMPVGGLCTVWAEKNTAVGVAKRPQNAKTSTNHIQLYQKGKTKAIKISGAKGRINHSHTA